MPDNFHPSVDISFLEGLIKDKLAKGGIIKIGTTTTYIVDGPQAIFKRCISVRELENGQVCFEQAMAIAIRFSCLGSVMDWLKINRSWKEGAYILQDLMQRVS